MVQVAVHEVPVVRMPGDGPHPLTLGCHGVDVEVHEAFFGQHDLVLSPQALTVAHATQRYTSWWTFAALPAGLPRDVATPADVMGFANVILYLRENTARSTIQVSVRPRFRGAGVGDALWTRTVDTVKRARRREVETWTYHRPIPTHDPRALRPRGGVLAVDAASAEARWVLARGFTLRQTERHSVFSYPADRAERAALLARLGQLRDAAAAGAGSGYRLVQWQGATPWRWMASMARLRSRMSLDHPSGDLDLDASRWDEDRVYAADVAAERRGLDRLTTAAVDETSQELVAYTEVSWERDARDHGLQGDTFVSRRHRGKRLGMLLKASNMQLLPERLPELLRVHARNPSEDRYVLGVNHRLGFVQVATWGRWTVTL